MPHSPPATTQANGQRMRTPPPRGVPVGNPAKRGAQRQLARHGALRVPGIHRRAPHPQHRDRPAKRTTRLPTPGRRRTGILRAQRISDGPEIALSGGA